LWGGMQLTTLHKMFALNSDEVSSPKTTVFCALMATGDLELPRARSSILAQFSRR
jgi:hypothetical protein